MHCNSYKSHTDVRYRFFGAPGRFRGSFPDIHNAKVEIATPESFGDAVKAQFEFKPLQPITTSKSRFSLDVGDLLGIKGAPTLVVSPNPPFLINNRTEWNPQVEMQGETEDGIEWEARYTVSNDGAARVIRSRSAPSASRRTAKCSDAMVRYGPRAATHSGGSHSAHASLIPRLAETVLL